MSSLSESATSLPDRGDTMTAIGGESSNATVDTAAGTGQAPDVASGDKPGPNWLVWVAAWLVAVVALAWALSQIGGGETVAAGEAPADDPFVSESISEVTTDDRADDTAGDPESEELDVDGLQRAIDVALGTSSAISGLVAADGSVTLTGTVDSDDASANAEDTVNRLDGVSSVTNEVVVQPPIVTEPVTINDELSLDPITFEVASATITAEGRAVLDRAAEYLIANSDVTVEIAGHTDSDGNEAANVALSQDRAEAVKAYLEDRGIDGDRLTPRGYGQSQPIASNDTPTGKARNRRMEFVIQ